MVLIGFFLVVVIAEQVEEVDVGPDAERAGMRHRGTDHAGPTTNAPQANAQLNAALRTYIRSTLRPHGSKR